MRNFGRSCKALFCYSLLSCALSGIPAAQAQGDITPPEVVELNFDPMTIEDNSGPQPVTFSLRITDDSSGFQSASWHLVSPSNAAFHLIGLTAADRISGTALDGVYAKVFDLPAGSETGTWHLARVRAADAAGNIRTYDDMPFYADPAVFTTGGASRVYADDFNNDNIPDIAVLSGVPQVPVVYLGSGSGTFGSGLTSGEGGPNGWPYIGDFNGDGTPDIAIREVSDDVGGTSPVGVLFGYGDGTFLPYKGMGSLPYNTIEAAGDFDGDGISDMAGSGGWGGLLDEPHGGIIFLWGRTDGNFDRSAFEGSDYAYYGRLFSADFNGDGIPDLVRVRNGQGKFVVVLGLGSRTFDLDNPIENSSAGEPDRFAAADFNNDGKMDLAVIYSHSIGILRGNGDGTFQPVAPIWPFNIGEYSGGLPGIFEPKIGDFDGDGWRDFAINANEGVMLLVNNCDGTFRRYALTAGSTDTHGMNPPYHFGIEDFNADGRTDFVALWNDYKTGVYLGIPAAYTTMTASSATSTLGQPVTLSATVTPAGLRGAVTFYDGAAVLGIAALAEGQASLTISMLEPGPHALRAALGGTLADAAINFSSAVNHTVNGLPASKLVPAPEVATDLRLAAIAAGDFNGDGLPDLIAGGGEGSESWIGDGDGGFQSKGQFGTPSNSRLAVGDMNQDGDPDVAYGGTHGGLYQGIVDGTFAWLAETPNYPRLGDFNRDGKLDYAGVSENFTVLLGLGNGNAAVIPDAAVYISGHQSDAALGDFNGDENLDAALATDWEDKLTILLGNGDGTFQTPIVTATGTRPTSIAAADFNLDAKLDLAITRAPSGIVEILLGEGDGSFMAAGNVTIGGILARSIAADLNGDEYPDLAVLSETKQRALIFAGNGDGTFGDARTYYVGPGATDLVAADFNADGRMDLAVTSASATDGKIVVFLGANPSPTSVLLDVTPPSSTLSQQVTMTASVSPPAATGRITFYDGATALGSVEVSAGQAVFPTRVLSSGTHSLRAVFSGDGTNYDAGYSSFVAHTVKAESVHAFGPEVSLSQGAYQLSTQGDFNGDGIVDLAVCSGGFVTIFLGQESGPFVSLTPFPGGGGGSFLAADFDGDGKTDILLHPEYYLKGNGDGTFEPVSSGQGIVEMAMLSADFNGDGAPDLFDLANAAVILSRGDGTFEYPIELDIATFSYSATAGDLNEDGRTDLVLSDVANDYVHVLLGKGDGTFLAPAPYPTVDGPVEVRIVDFNGDGKLDLAVGGSAARIGIMLGLGDGTFENWGDAISGLTSLQSFETCDCDGDGKTDLLAVNWGNVKFVRGLGDGTFENGIDYLSMPGRWLEFATDLNADGRPDLIAYGETGGIYVKMAIYPSSVGMTANPAPAKLSQEVTLTATLTPGDASGTVAFYDDATLLGKAAVAGGQATLTTQWLGAGVHRLKARYSGDPLRYVNSYSSNVDLAVAAGRSGGFEMPAILATGRGPRGIAAGDLNGDGKQDIVVANTTSNTLSVLLGNGNGTFATRVNYNTGSAPIAVAIADLNGDGKPDVTVANSGSSNVGIMLGNGNGTLQTMISYGMPAPKSLSVADVDDDQITEILAGINDASWGGIYMMQYANGAMSGVDLNTYYSMGIVNSVGASDLNGDGRIDLLPVLETGRVDSWLQQPGGTFSPLYYVGVGATPSGLAMGDFNGDGKLDLATANTGSNNASVALGNGDGTFQTAVPYATGTGPVAIVATDCNGDGDTDLVLVNGSGNSVTILPGNGDGTFMAGSPIVTGGTPAGVVAADFNGDGIVDLAVSNSADNTVSLFLGTEPKQITDFDGDGNADILWRHAETGENYVWYMDGVTVLSGGVLPTVADQSWQVVGVGDFNYDSKPDILWRHAATGENYVWYLDGVTVLNGGTLPTVADQSWQVVGVGDFNYDSKPDILWRHAATGENYVWYLDGVTVLGGGTLPTVTDQNWNVVGVADFNNDDKPDVLWRHISTGENYVWYLDGVTVLNGGGLPTVADQNWQVVGVGDFNYDSKPDILWHHASTVENYVWYMDGVTVLDGGVLPTVTDQDWAIVP